MSRGIFMLAVKTKMHRNGRIVIPAEYRRKLHLKHGDEILICFEDNELRILAYKQAIANAQSLVEKYNPKNKTSLTDLLFAMRKEELKHE
jgi:AbrB family looped-hinge helix DNA binding protein